MAYEQELISTTLWPLMGTDKYKTPYEPIEYHVEQLILALSQKIIIHLSNCAVKPERWQSNKSLKTLLLGANMATLAELGTYFRVSKEGTKA